MSDTPGNPELLRREIATVDTPPGSSFTHTEVAASPLGTDSEAGGTPPTKAEVQQARGLEGKPKAGAGGDASRTRSVTANPYGMPILLAAAASVVFGGVLWVTLT